MPERHLFIAGAQKCGTSTLSRSISLAFDEIELSDPKEPMVFSLGDFECHRTIFCDVGTDFFVNNENKQDLYRSCFSKKDSLKLDASTSYMISEKACKAIKDTFPDAKILILLRDPVERMVSAYWHYVRTGLVCHKFDRAMELGPLHMINIGFYKFHLDKILSIFDKSNVLVASDRHVYKDPKGFLKIVENFIGLKATSSLVLERDNAGTYPSLFRFQLFINYIRQCSGKNYFHRAVTTNRFKQYGLFGGVAELFSRYNLKSTKRDKLSTKLLERIVVLYKEENQGIDSYIDFGDISHWYGDYSHLFSRI